MLLEEETKMTDVKSSSNGDIGMTLFAFTKTLSTTYRDTDIGLCQILTDTEFK